VGRSSATPRQDAGELRPRARLAPKHGITWNEPENTWSSTDAYLDAVREQAETFRLDR
jgi:hypothetical protein